MRPPLILCPIDRGQECPSRPGCHCRRRRGTPLRPGRRLFQSSALSDQPLQDQFSSFRFHQITRGILKQVCLHALLSQVPLVTDRMVQLSVQVNRRNSQPSRISSLRPQSAVSRKRCTLFMPGREIVRAASLPHDLAAGMLRGPEAALARASDPGERTLIPERHSGEHDRQHRYQLGYQRKPEPALIDALQRLPHRLSTAATGSREASTAGSRITS